MVPAMRPFKGSRHNLVNLPNNSTERHVCSLPKLLFKQDDAFFHLLQNPKDLDDLVLVYKTVPDYFITTLSLHLNYN